MMTNGMVDPGRYQSNAMMGYEFHDGLSSVFDAAFSAAAAASGRRPYAPGSAAPYDGMPPPPPLHHIHQVHSFEFISWSISSLRWLLTDS